MAQPIKANIPPFCLCIFGTDNKFDASDVMRRWDFVVTELQSLNIQVLGISSDGDSRLLKSMKICSQLGTTTPSNNSYQNCSWYSVDERFICVQDPTHVGTKLRNRLLKPSILLPIGKLLISKSHLAYLIKTLSKDKHLLTESVIDPKDRQNFNSFLKISTTIVQELLVKHVPDSDGTALFLKISRLIIDSYMDPDMLPIERVYSIWYGTFVLRGWRAFIIQSKKYVLSENFISTNAFTCVELNAHSMLNLISVCREDPQLFLPSLFSSQPCESTFRQFRSMSTTYSTQV